MILLWFALQSYVVNGSKAHLEAENYPWVMDRFVTMDERLAMPILKSGDVVTFYNLKEDEHGFLSSIDCLNLGG